MRIAKNRLFSLLLTVGALFSASGVGINPSFYPDTAQQDLIDRGYGMFIHFGMNTFLEQEWSDGTAPANVYAPTHLDPEQWVKTAADAGFRYVIITAKHHDGFCLWDSKLTDYDVSSTSQPMDVVKAVADACRKYGLKFGIYYSLWDRHEPTYTGKDFKKYIDFMEGQLKELLTDYGDVCEIWFDGGWDKPATAWQIPRLYKTIKKLQPNCAVGINNCAMLTDKPDQGGFEMMASPEDMVNSREKDVYFRYFPMDFRLADPKIANRDDRKIYTVEGKDYYQPFEHTICLSKKWTWFQKDEPMEVRDLDELQELFYWCTDNDNALVINVPPDKRGLIRDNERNAVVDLGNALGLKAGKPLPKGGNRLKVAASSDSVWENDEANYGAAKAVDGGMTSRWASQSATPELVLSLDPEDEFDKIVIFEYLDDHRGADFFTSKRVNRIREYEIDIMRDGRWEAIYVSDAPMGDCKVIRFPQSYKTSSLRLKVRDSSDCPSINEILIVKE